MPSRVGATKTIEKDIEVIDEPKADNVVGEASHKLIPDEETGMLG